MQNKSKFLFKYSLELIWGMGNRSQNRTYCDNAKLLFFRAGISRNPSGGSNNGSNNPGGLPPQFVQVEMTSPDDQQSVSYTHLTLPTILRV